MSNYSRQLDIDFNLEALHYSLRNIAYIQTSLNSLVDSLENANSASSKVSDDVSSIHYINEDISAINNYKNDGLNRIYNRLERTKNILINMDADAKYFFMNIDNNILDENLNLIGIPAYNQLDYINAEAYAYASSTIEKAGCGLCSLATSVSLATGILFLPGQLATIAYNDNHGSNKTSKMFHILSFLDGSVDDQNVDNKDYVGYEMTLEEGNDPQVLFNSFCDLSEEGKIFTIQLGGSHFVACIGNTGDGDDRKLIIVDSNGGSAGNSGLIKEVDAKELGFTFGDPNSTVYNVIDPYEFTASTRVTDAEYKYVTKISENTMNAISENLNNENYDVDYTTYDKQSEKYGNVHATISGIDYNGMQEKKEL